LDRRLLKNIIILILLLVNVFLAGSLFYRKRAERDSWENSARQLSELFAADGIALDADLIPQDTPPAGIVLTRSKTGDSDLAASLLGRPLTQSSAAGGDTYTSSRGSALFRDSGTFEAAGTLCGDGTDADAFCRQVCEDLSYGAPVLSLDDAGTGTATAAGVWNGMAVYNCTLSFSVDRGSVTAVSGRLLAGFRGGESSAESDEPLSALAALTAFQQTRRETSAVASEVTDIRLCYELQSSPAAVSLVPAWCISTDAANYYVNCISGVVTAG